MRFICFYLVVCILSLSQAGFAQDNSLKKEMDGQNWPRHRGDQALQGISYAKIGTKLKSDWEFKTGEFLKSSVVISEGLAFVGAETGMLFAISIEDGKEKWKYKTNLGIDAPPLVHDEIVYIGSTDGFLYALNIEDGKLLWKWIL